MLIRQRQILLHLGSGPQNTCTVAGSASNVPVALCCGGVVRVGNIAVLGSVAVCGKLAASDGCSGTKWGWDHVGVRLPRPRPPRNVPRLGRNASLTSPPSATSSLERKHDRRSSIGGAAIEIRACAGQVAVDCTAEVPARATGSSSSATLQGRGPVGYLGHSLGTRWQASRRVTRHRTRGRRRGPNLGYAISVLLTVHVCASKMVESRGRGCGKQEGRSVAADGETSKRADCGSSVRMTANGD